MPEQYPALDRTTEANRAGCMTFEAGLAAYLEGEVRPEVVSHARECTYCGVILADLETIMAESRRAGAGAPIEPGPSPRVWANIRATLEAEGYFRDQRAWWERWFPRWSLAPNPVPLAVLGVAVLAGATLLLSPRSSHPGYSGREQTANLAPSAMNMGVISGQQELQQAVRNLEKAYRERAVSFEPAVKLGYEKGLSSLDASIEQAELSVKEHPDNDLARDYLLTAYEQKAEVLATALEFNGR